MKATISKLYNINKANAEYIIKNCKNEYRLSSEINSNILLSYRKQHKNFEKQYICQSFLSDGDNKGKFWYVIYSKSGYFRSKEINIMNYSSGLLEEKFIKHSKINTLIQLEKGVQSDITRNPTHESIKADFCSFLENITENIFYLVSAHSVTVRLFNPNKNSLDILHYSEKDGTGYIGSNNEKDGNSIKLKNYKTSVNAFAFVEGYKNFDYIYLPDLGDKHPVPEKLRKLGLCKIDQRRASSRSEFCLPITSRKSPIGTINFESDTPNSFDTDIEFLLSIKFAIEQKYQNYFSQTDTSWLSERSILHEAIHDLKNNMIGDFFDESQKAWLEKKFRMSDSISDTSPEIKSFGDLKTSIRSWIRSHFSDLEEFQVLEILNILEFYGDNSTSLSSKLSDELLTISKHLIINIENYSFIDRDKIRIHVNGRYGEANEGASNILVRYKTFGYFKMDALSKATLQPIERSGLTKKRRHYGLYLVSLLVRSRGGAVFFGDLSSQGFRVIEFSVPTKT